MNERSIAAPTRTMPHYRWHHSASTATTIDLVAPRPSARGIASPRSWQERCCRMVDIFFALGFLLIFAVPMLVIAVVVKCTSPGPILFKQVRIGRHGRPFLMWKFRTMHVDAEAASGPVWAIENDPRCTPCGNWLRRSSFDELPQFLNVLRGEMSLVGPRPERPYFVRLFSERLPEYDYRHSVPPGITGWAQLNGWRGNTSVEKRLEHDLYYVDHWSVAFNLRILLQTPFAVFSARNAH
jgi:exopolysaccharide biosynthesis polyprenyl glycosylphosphotransferase